MELITKKETRTVQETKRVDVEVYRTSDGKEFPKHEKLRAEIHQKYIDAVAEFKARINYKETGLDLCRHYRYELNKSFTFDWDADTMSDIENKFHLITGITPKGVLNSGKYLVIEYMTENHSDNGDSEYYDGFFGTTEEYLKMLDEAKADALAAFNE